MSRLNKARPRPLPGHRVGVEDGLFPYVINLKDVDLHAEKGRQAVVKSYERLTGDFLIKLKKTVEKKHLEKQIAAYGDPSPFPVITLSCTPAVAKVIEGMTEVTDVYRDEPVIGVVD